MAATYWIKLFVEIIDDPKYMTLPDRLQARFIHLLCIAGREGKNGLLPDTPQIAWILRTDSDDLAHELQQLVSVGMVERTAGGWLVKNFAKRQAPIPADERYREFRKRNPQYTPPGLQQPANETQTPRLEITDTDTDTEDISSITPFSKTSAFIANLLNVQELNGGAQAWNEGCKKLIASNVTEADIKEGYQNLLSSNKEYTIIGPQSLVVAAINARMRRENPQPQRSNGNGSRSAKPEKNALLKRMLAEADAKEAANGNPI